jgi:hypothetical protein
MLAYCVGLGLFGLRTRQQTAVDDLDIALAGAQIGLERKRRRWLLFLIEKEEECLARMAQAAELDADGAALVNGLGSDSHHLLTGSRDAGDQVGNGGTRAG